MSAIKFIKSSVSGKLVRPQGYAYPTGLNAAGGSLSVSYLMVAGGAGGGPGLYFHTGDGGGGSGARASGGDSNNTRR